jgi:hypothetical protein
MLILWNFKLKLKDTLPQVIANLIHSLRLKRKLVPISVGSISDGIRNFNYGVIAMNHFNEKIWVASVLMALGSTSNAWADPASTTDDVQVAIVDTASKGQGNAAASDHSSSTSTTTNTDSSQDNDTITKTDTQTQTYSDNDTATKTDTKTISKTETGGIGEDGKAKADNNGAAVNGSGTATSSNQTSYAHNGGIGEDGFAKAEDNGAAVNGSGSATSNKTYTGGQGEDAYVKAKDNSAAANNGNVTSTVATYESAVKGDGSASANVGNATATYTATYIEQKLFGFGNAASGSGDVTVNNQKLDGVVTGIAAVVPIEDKFSVVAALDANKINGSVIGNAGITQTFQNSGTALNQQNIQVSGTINIGDATATVPAP